MTAAPETATEPTVFSALLAIFWDDSSCLRWKVGADNTIRFQAVWADDEDVETIAPINVSDLPDLQARFDAELALGANAPWEFIEEYIEARNATGAATVDGYGTEAFAVDEFTRQVFALFEGDEGLSWSGYGTTFLAGCSDFFFWGCSDVEEIEPADIDVLVRAFHGATAAGHPDWTSQLFAAMKRKMRPQGAYYEYIPESMVELFDVCGPERTPGFGDPRSREQGIERGRATAVTR